MDTHTKVFESVATFDNSFVPQLAIAQSMLEDAGIDFIVVDENYRSSKTVQFTTASAISIELRVDSDRMDEALEIMNTVQTE